MNRYALAAVAVGLGVSAQAQAAIFMVDVLLDGFQEVPPVATPGSGQATVTVNTSTREVSIAGTFADLIGTTTAAHLHGLSTFGVNSGILFGLTIDTGVTSGSFGGSGVLSVSDFDGFMNNLTYINIHSSHRPGGEIRGQVVVPEPVSAAVLGLSSVALLLRRRRSC